MIERAIILKIQKEQPNVQLFIKLILMINRIYYPPSYVFDLTEILKTAGFQIIVTLPTVMLMLVIASACKNMWVSLGIGVILVFTLSILPQDNIVLSLFPFASPYQMLSAAVENSRTALFLAVCGIETVVFGIAEVLYLQVRRCFE